jgi:hypothetical protein
MDTNYEAEGKAANVIAMFVGTISWVLLIVGSTGMGIGLHP